MLEKNKIYTGDNRELIKKLDNDSIHLNICSPNYDDLRDYQNGYILDYQLLAKELYRVLVPGGVCVWVVNDATVKGSETGSSFRQALAFLDNNFFLHDTMIYLKPNFSNPSKNRYHQIFEFMFVFSKGKPRVFNPICDKKNKYGVCWGKNSVRQVDGTMIQRKKNIPREFGMRGNVWLMNTAGQENPCQPNSHPAQFPEALARDHIISWSNRGDTVLDIFSGSGTVGLLAKRLGRNYIGFEISPEYCKIAEGRIAKG